ncbi:N-alpha-acetyltransferase mak3, variant 2, partial [Lathyrus oleraceus]
FVSKKTHTQRTARSKEEQEMETTNKEEPEISKLDFNDSDIEYISYGGEHHLPLIMNLVDEELSEPYSIFTYRYFVYLWPHLSFLVPNFSSFHFFYFSILSQFVANHFNFDSFSVVGLF